MGEPNPHREPGQTGGKAAKAWQKPEPSVGSWSDIARSAIAEIDASFTSEDSLEERIAAVDAAYPFPQDAHSQWQAWQRIRRQYLTPYGYVPAHAPEGPPLHRGQNKKRRSGSLDVMLQRRSSVL